MTRPNHVFQLLLLLLLHFGYNLSTGNNNLLVTWLSYYNIILVTPIGPPNLTDDCSDCCFYGNFFPDVII